MGFKKIIDGYHVEVEPHSVYSHSYNKEAYLEAYLEDTKRTCEDMVQEIRRHIDNVEQVDIIEESHLECEFCGSRWTEGEYSSHNGGCCGKDAEVYLKEKTHK